MVTHKDSIRIRKQNKKHHFALNSEFLVLRYRSLTLLFLEALLCVHKLTHLNHSRKYNLVETSDEVTLHAELKAKQLSMKSYLHKKVLLVRQLNGLLFITET